MGQNKDRYHHGDLRQALLEAGLKILEEDGLEGVTLRRIAAAAGVSHAAPAHHFPTLKNLFTALGAIAFQRFGQAMKSEREKAESDPASQIRAAGHGYVSFAAANPGLFRLMFSSVLLDWEDAGLREAADASFRQLEDIVSPIAGKSDTPLSRQELLKLVWCSVHGYAHLHLEGQMEWLEGSSSEPPRLNPPDIAALLLSRR